MSGSTFAEKILCARRGEVVTAAPDLILSHDNSASIAKTFSSMGGGRVRYPERLVITLDHNAPPTNAALANDYQAVRTFVAEQGLTHFHDAGSGICHQLMAEHARPGMLIAGSDSHTCTAGAFNTLAVGIDRTETAGLWLSGRTWFRVPETLRVILTGKLPTWVFAKDLATHLIGMLGADGANYLSIEFHGPGVDTLGLAERMTLCNLASEMGAKNAVFPADAILAKALGPTCGSGMFGDEDADYLRTVELDLCKIVPLVACPHAVDNVRSLSEVVGTPIHQCFLGTCSNGRLEDLALAAKILAGKHIAPGVQFLVTPASRDVFLAALRAGIIATLVEAGACILSASCGPCLGTGQGIPADGWNVLSTANRNFKGRMGNKTANIYLASPAVVAMSALQGAITDPRPGNPRDHFEVQRRQTHAVPLPLTHDRRHGGILDLSDLDDLNTDLMFAGNLTYQIKSSDPAAIVPHLFEAVIPGFGAMLKPGDVILAGENFGCGSSREHPAVGLRHAGVAAVVVKSAARIFYRAAINQGLLLLVCPEAVTAYRPGHILALDLQAGWIEVGSQRFPIPRLTGTVADILAAGGLKSYLSPGRT